MNVLVDVVSSKDHLHKVSRFRLGGNRVFNLACGHTAHAKVSAGSPRKKHCRECARAKTTNNHEKENTTNG